MNEGRGREVTSAVNSDLSGMQDTGMLDVSLNFTHVQRDTVLLQIY
jgi:hypothetical protein